MPTWNMEYGIVMVTWKIVKLFAHFFLWAAKVLFFFSCSIARWNAKKMVITSLLQKLLNKCHETSLKKLFNSIFRRCFFGLSSSIEGWELFAWICSYVIFNSTAFHSLSLSAFYFGIFKKYLKAFLVIYVQLFPSMRLREFFT